MTSSLENKLMKFLNLYWLRPENGLMMAFKSENIETMKFESPSLDLSCGDGMFMFTHLGGTFSNQFDYFKSTNADKFSHDSTIDIYDKFDPDYSPEIISYPKVKIDYGLDWKQNLLDKASKLNIHDKLILHDNNDKLPFSDNFFKIVYSNSLYWVDNIDLILSELHRSLHPDGQIFLQIMTPYHIETLDKLEKLFSKEAIDILDRNRRKSYLSLRKYEEWVELFTKSGFKIKEIKNSYPNEFVLDLWNVGLRPIAHLLIQMSEALSSEKYLEIKKHWVDIFYKLFKPLLYSPETYKFETSPYLLFVLEK